MTGRFFRTMVDILRTPWVLLLLLTLLLILLVWFVGPLVAVAGYILLESVVARLVATVILIFLWGLFVAVSTTRQKKKALADPAKAEQHERETMDRGRIREELDYIRERLRAAIKTVTKSNFYGPKGRSRYVLPWYLMLGAKDCGKTSFLLNSGLKFPLNEQADRHLYTLKATEHCEILYGNDAVFLDTPGTYADSRPESAAHKIWMALLGRIFSVRPARPLNGVIVCVSMRDIMDADQARREHLARTIRTRLGEVLKSLRSHVPVYLVFTKCDAVEGFAQFFSNLSRTEREQIFGCPAQGETMESGTVRQELKALMQTLNAQIIQKIHQERDIASRGDIFRFPQSMAALGAPLEDFITEAFGHSRYHKPVMFRGFFFSCALSAHDVIAAAAREGEQSYQKGFSAIVGDYAKGLFIHRLLEQHIIPEARLASTDKEQMWSLRLRRYGTQVAAVVLFLLSGVFLSASFVNNYSRLETLDTTYADFDKKQRAVPTIPDSKAGLPELDVLAASLSIYKPADDSAVGYGLGLYQGKIFDTATRAAYLGALNTRLMPSVRQTAADRVEQSLNDVATLKNALRAYLMLCQPKHLNARFINEWLSQQWSAKYPGDANTQQDLHRHMGYLIAHGIVPVEPDAELVGKARQAMLKIPLAELAYQRMKEEAAESGRAPFTFRATIGESPFTGDTFAVPALYTREGYEEYLIKRCPGIIRGLTDDNWIMGSNPLALSTFDVSRVHKEVRVMYFRDYTRYWNQAIQALNIRTPDTIAAARNLAAQLTTGTPPAVLALRAIKDNTSFILAEEAPSGEVADAAKADVARKAEQKLSRKTGGRTARAIVGQGTKSIDDLRRKAQEEAQREAAAVRQYFQPLGSLLDDSGNPNPALQAANTNMVSTGDYFARLLASDNREQSILAALLEIREEKDDTLRRMEISAESLPAPVRGWYSTVTTGGLRDMLVITARNINRAYQAQVVGVYDKNLQPYYPFSVSSERDVNLNDFSEFFRTGGVLDSFYDAYLQPFVTKNGALLRIMGRTLPLSGHTVAQLQRANQVQSAFFMSGRELSISILMEPYALDASLRRVALQYAGKSISYWHGPVEGTSFTWPADGGQGMQASIEFCDLHDIVTRKETQGDWALFRLLQGGNIKRQEGNRCLIEVQDKNGKWAQFLIQFRNKVNPFDPSVCSFALPETLMP